MEVTLGVGSVTSPGAEVTLGVRSVVRCGSSVPWQADSSTTANTISHHRFISHALQAISHIILVRRRFLDGFETFWHDPRAVKMVVKTAENARFRPNLVSEPQ